MGAAANLLIVILWLVLMAIWIISLADSDGHCHYEDCEGCPYYGSCDEQEAK